MPNGYNNYGYPNPYAGYPTSVPTMPQTRLVSNGLTYVHGIEGAYAFIMPPDVSKIILWDDTVDSFYIKGYDEMGKPKVLAWNDFVPHVEQKKEEPAAVPVDTTEYVTKDYLNRVLAELTIGASGRIVRSNEHDA